MAAVDHQSYLRTIVTDHAAPSSEQGKGHPGLFDKRFDFFRFGIMRNFVGDFIFYAG